MAGLTGRLFFLMILKTDYYSEMADLHPEERTIKREGRILDRNGVVIADSRTVCTISVVHNQIEDRKSSSEYFPGSRSAGGQSEKGGEKYSAREIIKTNVDKKEGDRFAHLRTCRR